MLLKKLMFLTIGITFMLVLYNPVYAGWENITLYDSSSSYPGTGWYGTNEDQEVEPGNQAGQRWDLEAFYFETDTWKLNLTGGYNFKYGVVGNGINFTSGDIFVDIDDIFGHGKQVYDATHYPNGTVTDKFGYEFVIKLDWSNNSYKVYDLRSDPNVQTKLVYYKSNAKSNPWKYVSGGTELVSARGLIDYKIGLSNTEATLEGTTLVGDYYENPHSYYDYDRYGNYAPHWGKGWVKTHNSLTVDFSWLKPYSHDGWNVKYTYGCGNDNIIAPEPGSLSLLLLGTFLILGRALLSRRKK